MDANLPRTAIGEAIALITAHDRVISALPPEARNEYKAALERHGAPVLEANTLARLAQELRRGAR